MAHFTCAISVFLVRRNQLTIKDSKLEEQLAIIPAVKDLDSDIGVKEPHQAHFPILAGDQSLLHRGQLNVQVELRQIEIWSEAFYYFARLIST
jgi:hypothetical protein